MPAEMYKVKLFYDPNAKVKLPSVMYPVKNFHETAKHGAEAALVESGIDHVDELERRQERILSKLAELRHTLDQLTVKYGAAPVVSDTGGAKPVSSLKQGSAVKIESPLGSGIHDIVINADPSSPPLSLFIVFEMLQQKYNLLATTYVHSSVQNVDKRLCDIVKSGSPVARGDYQIVLSLVWKQVEHGPELVVSPSKQFVITGEVNIIRYLNRILHPSFDTDDIIMATTFDDWLDVAESQLLHGNSKQKTGAVKSLNKKLKKNEWLLGADISLADVVMWSALHQAQQVHGAPENLHRWLTSCNTNPIFSSALSLISEL